MQADGRQVNSPTLSLERLRKTPGGGNLVGIPPPRRLAIMLHGDSYVPLSDLERQLFARLVPPDHFLRRLPGVIDFERFRPALAEHYCPGAGRPALDPRFMLKLDLLSIQFPLSDRELIRPAQVNVAYPLSPPPRSHPTPHPPTPPTP